MQAGGPLYWSVNVAGTISQTPYTATLPPNVTRVFVLYPGDGIRYDASGQPMGAVPLAIAKQWYNNASAVYPQRSVDGLTVSTTGGGIVVLQGRYDAALFDVVLDLSLHSVVCGSEPKNCLC